MAQATNERTSDPDARWLTSIRLYCVAVGRGWWAVAVAFATALWMALGTTDHPNIAPALWWAIFGVSLLVAPVFAFHQLRAAHAAKLGAAEREIAALRGTQAKIAPPRTDLLPGLLDRKNNGLALASLIRSDRTSSWALGMPWWTETITWLRGQGLTRRSEVLKQAVDAFQRDTAGSVYGRDDSIREHAARVIGVGINQLEAEQVEIERRMVAQG
jgi:hypothetical protein